MQGCGASKSNASNASVPSSPASKAATSDLAKYAQEKAKEKAKEAFRYILDKDDVSWQPCIHIRYENDKINPFDDKLSTMQFPINVPNHDAWT